MPWKPLPLLLERALEASLARALSFSTPFNDPNFKGKRSSVDAPLEPRAISCEEETKGERGFRSFSPRGRNLSALEAAYKAKIDLLPPTCSSPFHPPSLLPSWIGERGDDEDERDEGEVDGRERRKASQGYTQRSFFSRGKAWSGDARRPFVSCASRTRNALASHGHRSRLPLTSRGVVPRLCAARFTPLTHVHAAPSLFIPLSLSLSSFHPPPRHIPPSPSVPSLEEPGAFACYTLHPGNRIREIYRDLGENYRFSQPG